MQSKKQSLIETLINVLVGYIISLLSLFVVFPLVGVESTPGKNIAITCYFTLTSIARSYVIRRYFNNKKTTTTCQTSK